MFLFFRVVSVPPCLRDALSCSHWAVCFFERWDVIKLEVHRFADETTCIKYLYCGLRGSSLVG